ncbi:MAG: hypothetical protein ABSD44_16130 [Terracidiphilus sp.]
MSAEALKSIFDIATVVLLFLAFLAGAGVLVTGNVINARQARQLQQFDLDITKAKTDLGKEQERAANADALVAGLAKDASDAKAAQQRVETELAKQKERTASAEKAASDAALALARFKQPRALTPKQQDTLIETLKPFAGQHFAFAVFPDPEPLAFLNVLDTILISAGWKRIPSQIERGGGVVVEAAGESAATIFDSGIDAYIAPDDVESVPAQSALCLTLVSAGIHCETHRTPQLSGKSPRAITVSIGKKP